MFHTIFQVRNRPKSKIIMNKKRNDPQIRRCEVFFIDKHQYLTLVEFELFFFFNISFISDS